MPSIKLAPGPNRVQKNNSSSNSTNYNKALLKNLPKESLPSTEVAQILAQKDDFGNYCVCHVGKAMSICLIDPFDSSPHVIF